MPQVRKETATGQKRKTGGVVDRLVSGWDLTDTMSLLIYGRSGTGKTTLAATFPGPILWIVCSGGKKPGELRSIDTPEYRKKVTPVVVTDSSDVRELIAVGGNYATVVLDHATGLQDLILKEVLGLDELPAQKSWGMASQQQYGQCTMQCKEMLRALLSLDQHRIIVAQEREFNVDTESDLIQPFIHAALTPSLVGWLGPACDYICNTFIRERTEEQKTTVGKKTVTMRKRTGAVEYCLRTGPSSVYTTKFRIPRGRNLPDVLVDPSYAKIAEIVKG